MNRELLIDRSFISSSEDTVRRQGGVRGGPGDIEEIL